MATACGVTKRIAPALRLHIGNHLAPIDAQPFGSSRLFIAKSDFALPFEANFAAVVVGQRDRTTTRHDDVLATSSEPSTSAVSVSPFCSSFYLAIDGCDVGNRGWMMIPLATTAIVAPIATSAHAATVKRVQRNAGVVFVPRRRAIADRPSVW